MPKIMKFRYEGERTVDPILGLLEPGLEGEGDAEVVALKIEAGLLKPIAPPARKRAGAESAAE